MAPDSLPDSAPMSPPGTIDLPLPGAASNGAGSGAFDGGAGSVAAAPSPEPSPAPEPRGRAPFTVRAGILAAIVITGLAIALLYWKWYGSGNPSGLIVVAWPEKWDGAVVRVARLQQSAGELARVLDPAENNGNRVIRFHVPEGDYRVTVRGRDGRPIAESISNPKDPMRAGLVWWPFLAPPTATRAATRPVE